MKMLDLTSKILYSYFKVMEIRMLNVRSDFQLPLYDLMLFNPRSSI